jgi:hypothetical protein
MGQNAYRANDSLQQVAADFCRALAPWVFTAIIGIALDQLAGYYFGYGEYTGGFVYDVANHQTQSFNHAARNVAPRWVNYIMGNPDMYQKAWWVLTGR